MKTSIATVCLSGGLSEKLQAIAAAGFRGVEIFESDLLAYNGTPADVAREMSDLGLRAITFQPWPPGSTRWSASRSSCWIRPSPTPNRS